MADHPKHPVVDFFVVLFVAAADAVGLQETEFSALALLEGQSVVAVAVSEF